MAQIVDVDNINKAEYTNAYKRLNAFPLDPDSLFNSLESAQNYAQSSPVAYVGQIISVVSGSDVKVYKIMADSILREIGAMKLEFATKEEVTNMFNQNQ